MTNELELIKKYILELKNYIEGDLNFIGFIMIIIGAFLLNKYLDK